LNQIIPTKALNITKGKDTLGKYTYKGDSGKSIHCVRPSLSLHSLLQHILINILSSTAKTAPRTFTTSKKFSVTIRLCFAPSCWTRARGRARD
jgi:hypothetical protein